MMNLNIKKSIDTRRDALDAAFNLPPEAKKKAEEVFAQMEQLASKCTDQADFEQRMRSSPITEAYHQLFSSFVQYAKRAEGTPSAASIMKENASATVRSAVEHQTKVAARSALFRMMPEKLQNWWVYGIYNVPVLGEIITALNTRDLLKRITGRQEKKPARIKKQ